MNDLPLEMNGENVYAGFSKRFCAGWIDAFLIMLLAFLFLWISGTRNIAMIMAIPSAVLFAMFSVYFNAKFGGTSGKLAVGIRITKTDGSVISWSEAWKRSSIDLVFAFIILSVEMIGLLNADRPN